MVKDYIQSLIDKQIELYRNDPDRMISDYNGELQHISDYNGRQILELIQNADDQKADKLEVALDTNKGLLRVSNTGSPFSEDGYKSLMLSNLSSKTKEQFIGNKGLGFRSILNWANEIKVNSNGIATIFSGKIAKENFEKTFSVERRRNLRKQRGLSEMSVPWAILSTPIVIESESGGWSTSIELDYKDEYRGGIKSQLIDLNNNVLLFLNNLNEIRIDIDGQSRSIQSTRRGQIKTIGNESWTIYDSGNEELPDDYQDSTKEEKQHFNIKVALPDIIRFERNVLFSFFPTKIELDFPYILHGTFDLDSSRNQLNDTPKNRFVLSKMIKQIIEVAKEVSTKKVSWDPIRILSYKTKNPVLNSLGFYEEIERLRNDLPLFPCVDEEYRSLSECEYISDGFSSLLMQVDGSKYFPNMLKPIDEDLVDYRYKVNSASSDIRKKINDLSFYLLDFDIQYRASLIFELSNWSGVEHCDVLIDDSGSIIDSERKEVFTPLTSGVENIDLPDHVKVVFLNSELYEALLDEFSISSDQKARDLQRKVKHITTLYSYEPAELISKIISSTSSRIRDDFANSNGYVIDMVSSLFLIYISIAPAAIRNVKVPLIRRSGGVANSSDLFFSSDYPTGVDVNTAFGNLYSDEEFLADRSVFGLESDDEFTVEKYFKWLGVNDFVKYTQVSNDSDYIDFLHSECGKPVNYRSSHLENVYRVEEELLDRMLINCSLEQLVFWLIKDSEASRRMLGVEDTVKYSKSGEYRGYFFHQYQSPPAYLKFQLLRRNLFSDYWLSDDILAGFVNKTGFNYSFFDGHNVSKPEIDLILSKLGAKEKFEDFSMAFINEILRGLPEKDPKGKNTQKLYKLALEHYRKNKSSAISGDILLFAKSKTEEGYYGQNEIFYTDNIRLPSKLIENDPILNFPRRAGGKQVTEFFNVNNLDEVNIDILKQSTLSEISRLFNERLNKLKPYILAYRLDTVHKNKEIEARRLRDASLVVCEEVLCRSRGEDFLLDEYDYVESEGKYLIKINPNKNLDAIFRDSEFSDTLSEIICSVLRVSDHRNDIRTVLRDDISDTEHKIIKEIGYELLVDARNLLGVTDSLTMFWISIFKCLGLEYDLPLGNESEYISNKTGLDASKIKSLPYKTLDGSIDPIFFEVFSELGISISDYNQFAYKKIDFTDFHCTSLKSTMHSYASKFKSLLHESLARQPIANKQRFLNLVGRYEHSSSWMDAKSNEFKEIVDVDYFSLVNTFVEENFEISLKEGAIQQLTDIRSIFNENVMDIGIEEPDDLPDRIKSLLYFKGTVDSIRGYIEDQEYDPVISPSETDINEGVDIELTLKKTKSNFRKSRGSKESRQYKYSPGKDKVNRVIGLNAEILVRDALISKYSEEFVEHISVTDDSLGYDLRYSSDMGSSWRYVEVKRCSDGLFYLTSNELSFARDNQGLYELFLVDGDGTISKVEDVDFENEEHFTLVVKDYEVHFLFES